MTNKQSIHFERVARMAGIAVLVTVLLCTIPMRIYELLYLVDTQLGVFTQSSGWIYGLNVAIIAGGIAYVVLGFAVDMKPTNLQTLRSRVLCVLSILTAGCFVYDGYQVWTVAVHDGIVWFELVEMICCVTSAGAMILFAVRSVGTNVATWWEYAYFAPVLWALIQLVKLFISFTAISNVSENLFELFAYVALVLFLLNFVKVLMGFGEKRTMVSLLISGFFSSVFCSLITLPRYYVLLVRHEMVSAGLKQPDLICLMLGLFVLASICVLLCTKKCDALHTKE